MVRKNWDTVIGVTYTVIEVVFVVFLAFICGVFDYIAWVATRTDNHNLSLYTLSPLFIIIIAANVLMLFRGD